MFNYLINKINPRRSFFLISIKRMANLRVLSLPLISKFLTYYVFKSIIWIERVKKEIYSLLVSVKYIPFSLGLRISSFESLSHRVVRMLKPYAQKMNDYSIKWLRNRTCRSQSKVDFILPLSTQEQALVLSEGYKQKTLSVEPNFRSGLLKRLEPILYWLNFFNAISIANLKFLSSDFKTLKNNAIIKQQCQTNLQS